MELNKKDFLKTEFGAALKSCACHLDKSLSEHDDAAVDLYLAKWEVFQLAIKQFYGMEYHLTRTDDYFGVCTEDEDFLFKVCYQNNLYRVFRDNPSCVSGPFTADVLTDMEDADLYEVLTAGEYREKYGLEVESQL